MNEDSKQRRRVQRICARLLVGRRLGLGSWARPDKRLNHHKDRWWDDLDAGHIERIVGETRSFLSKSTMSSSHSSFLTGL